MLSAPGFAAQAFVQAAGPAAEGTYLITPDLPVSAWPSQGRGFAAALAASGAAEPGIDVLYGYSAAVRLTQAVETACQRSGRPARRLVMREALARPACLRAYRHRSREVAGQVRTPYLSSTF